MLNVTCVPLFAVRLLAVLMAFMSFAMVQPAAAQSYTVALQQSSHSSVGVDEGARVNIVISHGGTEGVGAGRKFSVTYSGTASPSDISGPSTVTIGAAKGENALHIFDIPIVDDTLVEPEETVIVTITPQNNTSDSKQVTFKIRPSDAPSGITFKSLTMSPSTVTEGGTTTATLTLSGAVKTTTRYRVSLSGSATPGASGDGDYTVPASRVITVSAGASTGTFALATRADERAETDETITITAHGQSTTKSATATVRNLAVAVKSLAVNPATLTEGNSNVTVTATLNQTTLTDRTFTLALGGTTEAGEDYAGTTSRQITVRAGARTGTVTLAILEDSIDEPDETIIITSGTGTATVTIRDDDDPVVQSVTANPNPVAEGSTVIVTVTLKKAAAQPFDVPLTILYSGGALGFNVGQGVNFTSATPSRVSFGIGDRTATYPIKILQDTRDEPNEIIQVGVVPESRTVRPGEAGVVAGVDIRIANDDAPTVKGLTVSPASVTEGNTTVTATLTLSNAVGDSVRFYPLNLSDSTATLDTDFTIALAPGHRVPGIRVEKGQSTGTATITIREDTVDEPDETIILKSGTGSPAETATVTIRHDDDPVVQSVTVNPAALTEGNSNVTVTVTLAEIAAVKSTFPLVLTGTATAGTDYTGTTSRQVTIAAGQKTGTVTLAIREDTIDEPDETIIVTSGSGNAKKMATITIQDDDTTVQSLTVNPASVTERDTTITVTLTLARTITTAQSFPLVLTGSATAGTDYAAATPSQITVAAGQSTGTYTIGIRQDRIDEDDETIIVTTGEGDAARTATITIEDDDTFAVSGITATPAQASENGQAVDVVVAYTASVTAERTLPVTFSGSATPNVDYSGGPAELKVAVGALSSTFRLTMRPDDLREGDETIIIRALTGIAVVTILDQVEDEVALLDEVRQQAGAALLRRNAKRFAFVTSGVIVKRLAGQSANSVSQDGRKAFVDVGSTINALASSKLRMQDRVAAQDRLANLWVSIEASRIEGKVQGEVFDIYAGVDYKLTRDVVVGALVSYETADVTTEIHDGGLKADGWSLGAYAGVQLAPQLTWDIAGSYGRQSPEVMAKSGVNSYFGSYESNRFMVSSHFTGHIGVSDSVVVKPTLGLLYGRVNQGTLTSRQGNTGSGRVLELGRLSAGPQIDFTHALPERWGRLDITASATGQYDILTPERKGSDDKQDRLSGALGLGLSWTSRDGVSVGIDSSVDGIGLKGYDTYNVKGNLKLDF